MVWALIHGDDPRPPHCPTPDNPFAEKKSISVDINWGLRFKTPAQVDAFLRRLCAEAVVSSSRIKWDCRAVVWSDDGSKV